MEKDVSNNNIGVRELEVDNPRVRGLLLERSRYAGKQLKIVERLKKLQGKYDELQKIIQNYNREIIDIIYGEYLGLMGEFEDIYEVKLIDGKRVVLRLKDAVEEIKIVAKDRFLENKTAWLKKKEEEKNAV